MQTPGPGGLPELDPSVVVAEVLEFLLRGLEE